MLYEQKKTELINRDNTKKESPLTDFGGPSLWITKIPFYWKKIEWYKCMIEKCYSFFFFLFSFLIIQELTDFLIMFNGHKLLPRRFILILYVFLMRSHHYRYYHHSYQLVTITNDTTKQKFHTEFYRYDYLLNSHKIFLYLDSQQNLMTLILYGNLCKHKLYIINIYIYIYIYELVFHKGLDWLREVVYMKNNKRKVQPIYCCTNYTSLNFNLFLKVFISIFIIM